MPITTSTRVDQDAYQPIGIWESVIRKHFCDFFGELLLWGAAATGGDGNEPVSAPHRPAAPAWVRRAG